MECNKVSNPYAIPPAPPWLAALIFAATSSLFFFSLYFVLPLLRARNVSWFACFNLVLALPMFLLVGLALGACAREQSPDWSSLRDRLRLRRMGISSWIWTVGLTVFMVGSRYANFIAFCAVVLAVSTDRNLTGQQRWRFVAGVATFLALATALGQTKPFFDTLPLHTLPPTFRQFWAHLTAVDNFMGLRLKGQWWIAFYYAFVLIFANIAGEELWWRGYLLPRQEVASGSIAWLYHGVFWTAFHLPFYGTAWGLLHMVPTCCALAFVAQHRKTTWPGMIAHTAGNMGVLLGIIRGVAA
jgi:membrane protease YdiL (CAAX protease family)